MKPLEDIYDIVTRDAVSTDSPTTHEEADVAEGEPGPGVQSGPGRLLYLYRCRLRSVGHDGVLRALPRSYGDDPKGEHRVVAASMPSLVAWLTERYPARVIVSLERLYEVEVAGE